MIRIRGELGAGRAHRAVALRRRNRAGVARLLLSASVVAGLGGGALMSAAPGAASAAGAASYTRVIGLDMAGGWGSQVPTVAQIAAQIPDVAQNLRVSWVRKFFDWWHIDQTQTVGSYDWSTVDPIMQAAARYHVGVVAMLGSPLWTGSTPTYPSTGFWKAFITAFVQRYDATNTLVIDPWNEPEQNTQGLSIPQFMSQLILPAYQAVKAADPSVLVTINTVDYAPSGGQAFWSGMVSAANGQPFVDLPGFHDYANLTGTWTDQLRSFLQAHNVRYTAIWSTEFGAAIIPPVSEPDQAHIAVLDSHVPPVLAGNANYPDAVFYYAYSDLSEGGVVRASYGLMDQNGSHYASYSVLAQLMGGTPAPGAAPTATPTSAPPPSSPGSSASAPPSSSGEASGSTSPTASGRPSPSAGGSPSASRSPSPGPSGLTSGGPASGPSGGPVAAGTGITGGGKSPPDSGSPWPPVAVGLAAIALLLLMVWRIPALRRLLPGLPRP